MITLIVLVLYPLAVQAERGGWWRLLYPVVGFALVLDVVANYTEMRLLFGKPRDAEYTITKRLSRMKYEGSLVGCHVCKFLDWLAPSGKHCR